MKSANTLVWRIYNNRLQTIVNNKTFYILFGYNMDGEVEYKLYKDNGESDIPIYVSDDLKYLIEISEDYLTRTM